MDMVHDDTQRFLGAIAVLTLKVSQWSGRRVLRATDITLGDGGKLPSKSVASLGSKKVIDPEFLNPFDRLKKRAEVAIWNRSVDFMGHRAVPLAVLDELRSELRSLRDDFAAERTKAAGTYAAAFEDWVRKNPDFEGPLRDAHEPWSSIEPRYRFRWAILEVRPEAMESSDLDREIENLPSTALGEVAEMAGDFTNALTKDGRKPPYNAKVLGTLKRIRAKLDVLSFVDPALRVLVDRIDGFLAAVPEGSVLGEHARDLLGIAVLLSSEGSARAYADGLAQPEDAFGFGAWATLPPVDDDPAFQPTVSGRRRNGANGAAAKPSAAPAAAAGPLDFFVEWDAPAEAPPLPPVLPAPANGDGAPATGDADLYGLDRPMDDASPDPSATADDVAPAAPSTAPKASEPAPTAPAGWDF